MSEKGRRIMTRDYGWCEKDQKWLLPMVECSDCGYFQFDRFDDEDLTISGYCKWAPEIKEKKETEPEPEQKKCPLLKSRILTNDQIGGVTVEFEEEPCDCKTRKCELWMGDCCAIKRIATLLSALTFATIRCK